MKFSVKLLKNWIKKKKTVLDSIDGQRWEQYFMNLYQEEPGNINLILPKKTNECQRWIESSYLDERTGK